MPKFSSKNYQTRPPASKFLNRTNRICDNRYVLPATQQKCKLQYRTARIQINCVARLNILQRLLGYTAFLGCATLRLVLKHGFLESTVHPNGATVYPAKLAASLEFLEIPAHCRCGYFQLAAQFAKAYCTILLEMLIRHNK